MTFLNGTLLFGAAALLVPLIIHILNRSRFKTVPWGAMHLLESVVKVNHRRFQIEQWILLLLRCSIPVLLAFCLARPVLTGADGLQGDAPVSLVVLLDTSYSMDTSDTAGTRFGKALAAAGDIIEATSRGSEISVIMTGGKPTPLFDQPVFDSQAVLRRLKQQQAGLGASDMRAALDEALGTLAAMKQARRELVIISDFQPADWSFSGGDVAKGIRQQIEAMKVPPELTLFQVGSAVTQNLSVDSLEFPRRAIGVGQRLDVRAVLQNHGPEPIEQARVTMKIDGKETSTTQLSLSPNGSTQTLFPCIVDQPGSHTLEVEVTTNDPLLSDNRFAAVVQIWDVMKVLLIDGDPSGQPLKGETDFLSVALTPYTFGRVQLSDLVETRTIKPNELKEEHLQEVRAVVLANVSKLSDDQLGWLTSFVDQGGALLITAGNRIDLNWHNEKLFAKGTGLLSAPWGESRGTIDEKAPGPTAHIIAEHFDHPALEFFNAPTNGDLSKAEIRRWQAVGERDLIEPDAEEAETTNREAALVLAQLDSGDPLLLEKRVGDGVVVQMTTAIDGDWSDLPLRPFYVPMMQQLLTTMASGLAPSRNIETGEPAVALLRGIESEASLSMLTPEGTRRTIQTATQGGHELARFSETQRPGIYALTLPSTETIHFAAETSRGESALEVMDQSEMASLAEKMGATVAESPSKFIQQDRLRRHGREVWRPVLMGLLSLLFLELVLQQRFARVRG
ncbi:MAG: BatA domain-containing protein [Planctomycetaceae bacterium]|nr:BatA domain-containing protein [Planctomycetaceae bacterium]